MAMQARYDGDGDGEGHGSDDDHDDDGESTRVHLDSFLTSQRHLLHVSFPTCPPSIDSGRTDTSAFARFNHGCSTTMGV